MMRVTVAEIEPATRIVRVEGRIVGPWAAELGQMAKADWAAGLRVEIDLSGVTFVDPAGVAALRALAERGAVLHHSSTFVQSLLDGGRA